MDMPKKKRKAGRFICNNFSIKKSPLARQALGRQRVLSGVGTGKGYCASRRKIAGSRCPLGLARTKDEGLRLCQQRSSCLRVVSSWPNGLTCGTNLLVLAQGERSPRCGVFSLIFWEASASLEKTNKKGFK